MALTDNTTVNGDKPAGGFFSKLSETLGSAVNAIVPAATTVLTAKYTAEAAKINAQAKTAATETGYVAPANAAAGSGFDWKHPLVIVGGALAAILTLGLVFRRR